jgi:uncharacterized protein YggE
MGVEVQAAGAAAALTQLWADLDALGETLTEAGVATHERQTSSLTVNVAYGPYDNGSPAGYAASGHLAATFTDPAAAAACIDAAAQRVGDRFRLHHTSWVVEPTAAQVATARAAAVADAVEAARQLASAADATLGSVRTIVEGSSRADGMSRGPRAVRLMAAALPELEPGETTFAIVVEVVHDID